MNLTKQSITLEEVSKTLKKLDKDFDNLNLDLDNKIKRFENLSKFSLNHTPLATLLENSRKKQEVGKKILELFNKQTEVIKSTYKYQELKRELVKLN